MRAVTVAATLALLVLTPDAFAQTDAPKQTETPKGYTGAPAETPPALAINPLPQIDNGSPGLDVAGPDGSTKLVRPVPCGTAAHETDGSTTCVGIEKQR